MSRYQKCVSFLFFIALFGCENNDPVPISSAPAKYDSPVSKVFSTQVTENELRLSRTRYEDGLYGFWLGQSIGNWTGLVTEMDKIGGAGSVGVFYTREDWGTADQPSIWGQGVPSDLSANIDWVLRGAGEVWGSDDDTDIEYIYQHLLFLHQTTQLTANQIRDGWLKHIYSDDNTPFVSKEGDKENYLWVSNQRAHDLMRVDGLLPPATSLPENNPESDMIDAQLTTEIFGLFAPSRPDIALQMAYLPIRTTASGEAIYAAEFYVILHSMAVLAEASPPFKNQIISMAQQARKQLPATSYSAAMYDFVWAEYQKNTPWETVRDKLYVKYQVNQEDGYDISARNLYCNGCFASGINFGASLISLFYGEGDFRETIKLATLMGWDSDNPAATWGGLLGFMYGKKGIEKAFGRTFSEKFNIHRTRGNFPNDGIDSFTRMANEGVRIIDNVVHHKMAGHLDVRENVWLIPQAAYSFDIQNAEK